MYFKSLSLSDHMKKHDRFEVLHFAHTPSELLELTFKLLANKYSNRQLEVHIIHPFYFHAINIDTPLLNK